MSQNANFLGNGRQIGTVIRVTLNWKDLLALTKNIFNEKKLITIVIIPLKEKNKYGQTHTVIEHVPQEKD